MKQTETIRKDKSGITYQVFDYIVEYRDFFGRVISKQPVAESLDKVPFSSSHTDTSDSHTGKSFMVTDFDSGGLSE